MENRLADDKSRKKYLEVLIVYARGNVHLNQGSSRWHNVDKLNIILEMQLKWLGNVWNWVVMKIVKEKEQKN